MVFADYYSHRDAEEPGSTARLCVCLVPGCGNHLFPRWRQDVGFALFPLTDQFMGIDLGCLSVPFVSLNMVMWQMGMVSVCPAAWAFLLLIKTGLTRSSLCAALCPLASGEGTQ